MFNIIDTISVPANEAPKGKIPELDIAQPEEEEKEEEFPTVPIEKISRTLMFQEGNASTAPTHSPRMFYEQLVVKDSGSVRKLWVWSAKDANWRYTILT